MPAAVHAGDFLSIADDLHALLVARRWSLRIACRDGSEAVVAVFNRTTNRSIRVVTCPTLGEALLTVLHHLNPEPKEKNR